jgi:tRNA-2-methylthio-N6-dimethylallyladenosine synthase
VGRTVEILVEGPSKVSRKISADGMAAQLVGRTTCDRIVVFDGPAELTGRIISIVIEKVDAFTLFGRRVKQ